MAILMSKESLNLENYLEFHLGIDDTDSAELGGCTTYIGTKLFLKLSKTYPMVILEEFPYLIRLNPNNPFRTKGNGSVIIKGLIHPSFISWFESKVTQFIVSSSKLEDDRTNPGLVIWYGKISEPLQKFGNRALWDIIDIEDLEIFIHTRNVYHYYPKNKRGLIGCFAGIGLSSNLEDYTFELLQYRFPPYVQERYENLEPIWRVDENDFDLFNCVDIPNKIIKIFPKGVDPVFCGIRGETPKKLIEYWNAIQPQPKMELWMIFKTNQGTDAHLLNTPIISLDHPKFLPFRVINIVGTIVSNPLTEMGGHVSFWFKSSTGEKTINCFAYEPTKEFRVFVLDLLIADEIEISGNIRPADTSRSLDMVINLEKIKILKLQEKILTKNPICPQCSKRMESAGKNQPFRCKKCKLTIDKSKLETHLISRQIKENDIYLPAIDAQRHLTKPLKRKEKNKFNDKKEILEILKNIFNQIN